MPPASSSIGHAGVFCTATVCHCVSPHWWWDARVEAGHCQLDLQQREEGRLHSPEPGNRLSGGDSERTNPACDPELPGLAHHWAEPAVGAVCMCRGSPGGAQGRCPVYAYTICQVQGTWGSILRARRIHHSFPGHIFPTQWSEMVWAPPRHIGCSPGQLEFQLASRTVPVLWGISGPLPLVRRLQLWASSGHIQRGAVQRPEEPSDLQSAT